MTDQVKTDTSRLISAINEALLGNPQKLPRRRDVGSVPTFTAPNVKAFVEKNQQSVASAKKVKGGFDRLAARWIREQVKPK